MKYLVPIKNNCKTLVFIQNPSIDLGGIEFFSQPNLSLPNNWLTVYKTNRTRLNFRNVECWLSFVRLNLDLLSQLCWRLMLCLANLLSIVQQQYQKKEKKIADEKLFDKLFSFIFFSFLYRTKSNQFRWMYFIKSFVIDFRIPFDRKWLQIRKNCCSSWN